MFPIKTDKYTIYHEEEDLRNPIDEITKNMIIKSIEEALADKYSSLPILDGVYLDEDMKNYALPTNSRNSSNQHHTLTFGTHIPLETDENDYIRFFTHWKNIDKNTYKYGDRVDIDIALELLSEDFLTEKSVVWYEMGGGRNIDTYHSGDIVNAPFGASEFIDLNYKKAREKYSYAVVTNCVFTGQVFGDIPECFSGVMFMNKKGKKGSVYNPEFIKTKFDLTQIGTNENVAFVVDLKTMELIWIDSPLHFCGTNLVGIENYGIVLAVKTALKKHMDFYSFIKLHSKHINFVSDIKNAKYIISDKEETNLKPFDVEEISAHWL